MTKSLNHILKLGTITKIDIFKGILVFYLNYAVI